MECEHCKVILKSKYNLKIHLRSSKSCLKLRGLEMESKFTCKGCNLVCTGSIILSAHHEICKTYQRLLIDEEHNKEITSIREQLSKKEEDYYKETISLEKIIEEFKIQKKEIELSHKKDIENKEKQHQREIETNENIIKDLQSQNEKLMLTIEKLASQAIDKTQTNITTHHTNNNSRNIYSDKYLLGNISEEFVQRKCQNYLTPQLFMEGQKGIAKLCTTHITQTPDKKVLLKCTDASRKKFKYIDEHGNIIEDYDARAFIEKVFQPIKKVTDIIYNTMVGDIEEEQENTEEDDYDRKSQLHDKLFKIMDCYARIINIDNPNQNSEFRTELAILNK